MTTHLARHFHVRRLEKGLRLGQVARMLGYRNVTKGSRLVQTFERTGKIDIRLLEQLAAALEIDGKTRNRLVYEDYKDWFFGKNQPVAPFLLQRGVWGCPEPIPVPGRLKTVEEIEQYAANYAQRGGWGVCLCFNNRIRICFHKDGTFQGVVEEVPRDE
jgi:hypothetical protein